MLNRIFYYSIVNLYIYSLIFIYINYSYPKYSYLGWQLNPSIDYISVFLVAMCTSLFVFFIKRKVSGPLDILVIVSYLVIYLPSLNLALICLESSGHFWSLFISYSVSMLILIFLSKLSIKQIRIDSLKERTFNNIFFLFTVIMFSIVFISYKPDFTNFLKLIDFSDVYELREGYRTANQSILIFINYFFAWLIKVFIPIIFAVGLMTKSKKMVLISCVMMLSMFLVSGHKSIVLGFGLVYLLYFLLKKDKLDTLVLTKYLIYLVFISLLLALMNINALQELVVRRAMLVPGLLSNYYFDYFGSHPFAYLGYSIFSPFVDYPYSSTPPYVIGEYYFNRSNMSANANYMAAAYADFGVIGTIVITFICGCYFKILNAIVSYKEIGKVSSLIVIVPIWALLDSSFITVMITHGLIWIVVFFLLVPKGFLNDKNN